MSASLSDIQRIQTEYRRQLLETWSIPAGSRVLEIGCGQGDMTAVLAEAVGPEGHVTAVDIADPSYGAPQTLAEATGLIKASPVGPRIDFRFRFDVLQDSPGESFDYAVLAHSSWYFASSDELAQTFSRLRPWAKLLCFAEWDMAPRELDQVPHMLAVLIQGQVEAFKPQSLANVRTPLSRDSLLEILERTGWKLASEASPDTAALQDADWEIRACLDSSLTEARGLNLPPKLTNLIEAQVGILRGLALPKGNRPLPAYSLVAEQT